MGENKTYVIDIFYASYYKHSVSQKFDWLVVWLAGQLQVIKSLYNRVYCYKTYY